MNVFSFLSRGCLSKPQARRGLSDLRGILYFEWGLVSEGNGVSGSRAPF